MTITHSQSFIESEMSNTFEKYQKEKRTKNCFLSKLLIHSICSNTPPHTHVASPKYFKEGWVEAVWLGKTSSMWEKRSCPLMWFDKAAEWDRWCMDGSNREPEIESRAGQWPSYLEWPEIKQDQTTDTCPSSDNISRRAPTLRTGLSIPVSQAIHAAWTGSTAASGRIGFMKRSLDLLLLSQQGQFLLSAALTDNVCRRLLLCLKLFGAESVCSHSVAKELTQEAQTQRQDCVSFPRFTVHTLVCYADHTAPPPSDLEKPCFSLEGAGWHRIHLA